MTATSRTPPPVRPLTDAERPDRFRAFLTDRATRKPSRHTLQAYRQDFDAIAALVASGRENIASLTPLDLTKDSMRQAFATFATSHEVAFGQFIYRKTKNWGGGGERRLIQVAAPPGRGKDDRCVVGAAGPGLRARPR